MSQHYTDPKRASDAYSLPDLEVFYRTETAIKADDWRDEDGDLMESGWYYWFCFPGCLPDSEPYGPFATEDEALSDARENAGVDDDTDDESSDDESEG